MNSCILLLIFWLLLQLYNTYTVPLKRNINKYLIGNVNVPYKEVKYLYRSTDKRRQLFDDLLRDVTVLIKWCESNRFPSQRDAERLASNWKNIQINETTYRDHVAYVIDKNRKFYLCASTPDGSNEDPNTMRFVVLHELAHMMSESYGHTEEFSEHFLQLIRVATHLGLYDPVNYSKNPVIYCGTKISHTPCETASCT